MVYRHLCGLSLSRSFLENNRTIQRGDLDCPGYYHCHGHSADHTSLSKAYHACEAADEGVYGVPEQLDCYCLLYDLLW